MKKYLIPLLLLFSLEAITQEIKLQYVRVYIALNNMDLVASEIRNVYNDLDSCNKALYEEFKRDKDAYPDKNIVYRNGSGYQFIEDYMEIFGETIVSELGVHNKSFKYCSPVFMN
jgi:hypothetical protein